MVDAWRESGRGPQATALPQAISRRYVGAPTPFPARQAAPTTQKAQPVKARLSGTARVLAPRPGLEPGTCGLTERTAKNFMVSKYKIAKDIFLYFVSAAENRPNAEQLWYLTSFLVENIYLDQRVTVGLWRTETDHPGIFRSFSYFFILAPTPE
jgi:hypothetical protein